MLLGKDMNATLVLYIIGIVRTVKANAADSLVFGRIDGPWYALLTQKPI